MGGHVQWRGAWRFASRLCFCTRSILVSRHNILGGSSVTENNVPVSGMVFHFGKTAATVQRQRWTNGSGESRTAKVIPFSGFEQVCTKQVEQRDASKAEAAWLI